MATFLPGVTDTIPQIQPWQPNYNFYENVRGRKQQQFDKGWNQVNSVYNSILNAPMMRTDNNETRDEYFDNIKNEINKIAGVDLSLEQNVQLASQIFEPFYNDDGIVKDMSFTKNFQDESKLAENLRRCTDLEKCGDSYWEGGVRLMQYQAQDFVNASAEDALGMANVKYVPHVNFMKEATKAAKEAGLSVEYDKVGGGWITTYKNGQALQQPLMNYFMARFGEDPRLKDFKFAEAGLMLRENPEQAAEIYKAYINNKDISEEDAKAQIKDQHAKNQYEKAKGDVKKELSFQESLLFYGDNKKNIEAQRISEEGVIPGSEQELSFEELIRAQADQEVIVEDLKNTTTVIKNTDGLINQFGINSNIRQVQSIIANSLLMKDMYQAAETLSYKDASVTRKVDPYAMERTQQKNRMLLQEDKYKRDVLKEEYTRMFAIEKKMHDAGIESKDLDFSGSLWTNPDVNVYDGSKKLLEQMKNAQITITESLQIPHSGARTNARAVKKAYAKGDYNKAEELASEVTPPNNGQSNVGSNVRTKNNKISFMAARVAEMKNFEFKTDKSKKDEYTPMEDILSWYQDNKDESLDHVATGMTNAINNLAENKNNTAANFTEESKILKKNIGTSFFRKAINLASIDNVSSTEHQAAKYEMAMIMTEVSPEIKKYYDLEKYPNYESYKKNPKKNASNIELNEQEFYAFKGMPTFQGNTQNNTSEYYSKLLSDIGVTRLTEIIGPNTLYNAFQSESINIPTNNPEVPFITIGVGRNSKDPEAQQFYIENADNILNIEKLKLASNEINSRYKENITKALQSAQAEMSEWNITETGKYWVKNVLDKDDWMRPTIDVIAESVENLGDAFGFTDLNNLKLSSYSNRDFAKDLVRDGVISNSEDYAGGILSKKAQVQLLANSMTGGDINISSKKTFYHDNYNKAIAGMRYEKSLSENSNKYSNIEDALTEVSNETKNYGKYEYLLYISNNLDAFNTYGGDGTENMLTIEPIYDTWNKNSSNSVKPKFPWGTDDSDYDLSTYYVNQNVVDDYKSAQSEIKEATVDVARGLDQQNDPYSGRKGIGSVVTFSKSFKIGGDKNDNGYRMTKDLIDEGIKNGNLVYTIDGARNMQDLRQLRSFMDNMDDNFKATINIMPSKTDDGTSTTVQVNVHSKDWEDEHKLNVENFKGVRKNTFPTSFTFTIPNSNNPFTKELNKNATDILINNTTPGGKFKLHSLEKPFGIQMEYRKDKYGNIHPFASYPYYDAGEGVMERRPYDGDAVLKENDNFEEFQSEVLAYIFAKMRESNDNERKDKEWYKKRSKK